MATIEQRILEIQILIDKAVRDAIKFDKGNFSAGTRVRKSLSTIRPLSLEIRKEISGIKHSKWGDK